MKEKLRNYNRRKIIKILGAGGLALFMGIGTLCGVLLTPMNSPLANAGATSASNAANLAGGAQSPDRAQKPQENLVAGEAIELNPQTDETLFTTESGFEIKSHTIAGQTVANSKVQYFTLGSYNGTPLNWIILASSSTYGETTTPAGAAIFADTSKQTFSFMTDSKLSANQMLVISERVFEQSSFSVSFTAHSAASQALPTSSMYGIGWKYDDSYTFYDGGPNNANYYGSLLLDAHTDYHTSGTTTPNIQTSINTLATGSTLGLSSYIGNKIVKNSNFSSNYAFCFTYSQVQTYIPTSVWTAKNMSGANSTYLLGSLTGIVNYTMNSTYTTDKDLCGWTTPSGTGTATIQIQCINASGVLSTCNAVNLKGTVSANTSKYSYQQGYNWYYNYVYEPKATYSITSYSTLSTKYMRPAMIVDISKF